LQTWDQYNAEFHFIHTLMSSQYYTSDPSSAKLFVVPQYGQLTEACSCTPRFNLLTYCTATHEMHLCMWSPGRPDVDITTCAERVTDELLFPILDQSENLLSLKTIVCIVPLYRACSQTIALVVTKRWCGSRVRVAT
jgi:hypothetical protein